MTVISVMKFNSEQGVIVADEQGSGRNRTSNIINKIDYFNISKNMFLVTGGTGSGNFLYDVCKKSKKELKENKKEIHELRDAFDIIGNVLAKTRKDYRNGHCISRFGITDEEFQTGMKKIDDGSQEKINSFLMNSYEKIIDNKDERTKNFNGKLVGIGYGEEGIEIYSISHHSADARPSSVPYTTGGSGNDMASASLDKFLDKIPRSKWENINPLKGTIAILDATNDAIDYNIGVGGIPRIAIIDDKKIYEVSENNSKLSLELVIAGKYDLIPKRFQHNSIKSLVFEKGEFKSIEAEMWEQTKDADKLSLLLRGYRI
jgi:hypothetical protein